MKTTVVDLNRTQPYSSNTVAQDARDTRVQRLQQKETMTAENFLKGYRHYENSTGNRVLSFSNSLSIGNLSKTVFDSEKKILDSART